MVVILLKMQISKIEVPVNLTVSTGCCLCKFEYFPFSGYCGEVANVSGKKKYNAVVAFYFPMKI